MLLCNSIRSLPKQHIWNEWAFICNKPYKFLLNKGWELEDFQQGNSCDSFVDVDQTRDDQRTASKPNAACHPSSFIIFTIFSMLPSLSKGSGSAQKEAHQLYGRKYLQFTTNLTVSEHSYQGGRCTWLTLLLKPGWTMQPLEPQPCWQYRSSRDKLYHIGLNTFFTSLASSLLTSFSTFLFSQWGSYKHSHFEAQGNLEHQILTHFTPFQEVIEISSILDPVSFEQGHKLCWEWGIRARKYFSLLKEPLRARIIFT